MLSWLYWHLGVNGTGPYYGFFSGVGSDIGEVFDTIALCVTAWTLYLKHNCHVTGCPWIARRPTAAGDYVCHKHHPEGRLTHADVIARHETAKDLQ